MTLWPRLHRWLHGPPMLSQAREPGGKLIAYTVRWECACGAVVGDTVLRPTFKTMAQLYQQRERLRKAR